MYQMVMYRHADRTRTEHVVRSAVLVVAVGATIGAVSLVDDAHASGQAVRANPQDGQSTGIPGQSQVVGAAVAAPRAGVPRARQAARARKNAFNPITPSGWRIPVNRYTFSAVFGQPGSWSRGYHTGLDFVTDEYRTVFVPASGIVVASQYEGAYGNLVQIRVKPRVEIWFAHLNDVDVTVGQRVRRGQSLGHVGMTGRTTGPHLHLEVRVKGEPVDPADFFWPNGPAKEFPAGP